MKTPTQIWQIRADSPDVQLPLCSEQIARLETELGEPAEDYGTTTVWNFDDYAQAEEAFEEASAVSALQPFRLFLTDEEEVDEAAQRTYVRTVPTREDYE